LFLHDKYGIGVKFQRKKRLREIDRRIRFLTKRIEKAEIVDPALQTRRDQVFFGATVTYENERGEEKTITIVGEDEANSDKGLVSWVSPIATALLKAYEGDEVSFRTPGGRTLLTVVEITYPE
jgi:transcription elongation factor GreB